MNERSPAFKVRVRGDLACFTRPEFKVERVSYEVMTPSAARGILEAVLWKPAIRWVVERIHVLNPVHFTSFKRNEIGSRIPVASVKRAMGRQVLKNYFADEDRQQRNTIALRNVDYIIECHYISGERWTETDNVAKYNDMFRRRLQGGQTYHHPYLGCREFPAEIEETKEIPVSILPPDQLNKDLGIMLFDLDFGSEIRPLFFRARLKNGIVEIPGFEAVKSAALAGGVI